MISNLAQLSAVDMTQVANRVEPQAILMCDPEYFDVIDMKNPFMAGNVKAINTQKSKDQWLSLKTTFEKLGYQVHVLKSQAGLEDMVFAANQVLPGQDASGNPYVLASRMVHASRAKEVPFYLDWFSQRGYRIISLPEQADLYFEGQGDALWHPGKQLLWGGYGHRTQQSAYLHLSRLLDVEILLLNLSNPRFYHLDTAFCTLDSQTVMIYPGAFDKDGLELIRHGFSRVLELSEADADNFAGNALALGQHVILQEGSRQACQQLREHGFIPIEVDTSEFMKSGGSVFCLKMLVY